MAGCSLTRFVSNGVTLLGDLNRPGGVTFAFTERTGGVSQGPYASLNLGGACGDEPGHVLENRRRALRALGAGDCASNLVMPKQVHGTNIVTVTPSDVADLTDVRASADAGADGIVCTAPDVPVMLCFADCVPVILVAPGAFAVVHSGWRGTLARISAVGVRALCDAASCDPSQVKAYIGPHITGESYEVSPELLCRFTDEFGTIVSTGTRGLDLGAAILTTLASTGVRSCDILDSKLSTARNLARFFSYRAEGGLCGRHGAMAFIPSA